LVGFLHLKPTAGCRISTLIFEFCFVEGGVVSINIPWKIYQGQQSSCPLGVSIKDIARVFNWLKCLGWVSAPQAQSRVSNINFDMQWCTMLWDVPYSTNSNVIPGISVLMGHSWRIPIQLNVTKFGFQIILAYLPATIIVYTFPFFSSKYNNAKGIFFFEKDYFCICSKLWLVN
jgi:hypothetical protein